MQPGAFAADFAQDLANASAGFSVPVMEKTPVISVRAWDNGYMVQTGHGALSCASVVLATGACGLPRVPTFASSLPASVTEFTSLSYRNPS